MGTAQGQNAEGQQEAPTQDQINVELARAVLLANGRGLTDEEKNRINKGEKADEVIKNTTSGSNSPSSGI